MSEETNTEQLQEKHSLAEYRKLRIAAQNELKEEIKFLKTEEEYQRLMADIEDHKARRLKAIVVQYQLQNPAGAAGGMPQTKAEAQTYDHDEPQHKPFAENEEPVQEEPKVRRLKKD